MMSKYFYCLFLLVFLSLAYYGESNGDVKLRPSSDLLDRERKQGQQCIYLGITYEHRWIIAIIGNRVYFCWETRVTISYIIVTPTTTASPTPETTKQVTSATPSSPGTTSSTIPGSPATTTPGSPGTPATGTSPITPGPPTTPSYFT